MRDRTAGLSAATRTHWSSSALSMSARWPPGSMPPVYEMRSVDLCRSTARTPTAVIDALVAGADPGLVATAGPRHFGFVIGGALPAALAADWMVSAWDQYAAFHSLSPRPPRSKR